MQVKDAGTWKAAKPNVKDAGVWKEAKEVWVRSGGVWVKAWTGALTGTVVQTLTAVDALIAMGATGNFDTQWGYNIPYGANDFSVAYGSVAPNGSILGSTLKGVGVQRAANGYGATLTVFAIQGGSHRSLTQFLIGPYTFTGAWYAQVDMKTGTATGTDSFGTKDNTVVPGYGDYHIPITDEQANTIINLFKAGPTPIAWR